MDDFYVPGDGGERYVKRLEARITELERIGELRQEILEIQEGQIAELEKVAEAAEIHFKRHYSGVSKAEHVRAALRAAGYLKEGA